MIRHQRQDRVGRFGRKSDAASADVQQAEARTTMQTDGGERFDTAGYEIDTDAIADAIVTRLLAGHTLRLPFRGPA